jgi:hypothetical protein
MPLRDWILRALVAAGIAIALSTELLSLFHAITFWGVLISWIAVGSLVAFRFAPPRWDPPRGIDALLWLSIAPIAALTFWTAIHSAPNSADAMAYHLPRVLYWIQHRSVEFFPAHYLNLLQMPPLAEYAQLHLFVLTGGDRLANLVQCTGFFGAVFAVSLIARELGAGSRGQALAAVFAATLPNGILQASGAKNDCVAALWIAAAVFYALRFRASRLRSDALWCGAAVGLAVFTKSTAYLFLPPLLLSVFGRDLARWRTFAFSAIAGLLLLNGPQYWRNWQLSGSPLGFDSAQADGFFRWQNDRFGWRETASNALRHLSEQAAGRDPNWNTRIYEAVLRAHASIGADPQDPATTWRWSQYGPPNNANHEADAPNRWHLLLFTICLLGLLIARRGPSPLAIAVVAGFFLFCFYLKWQPFQARLFLPLFVMAAPVFGWCAERIRPSFVPLLVACLLLSGTRLPLVENWTRPLRGPNSVLATARRDQYFTDMTPWHNKDSFLTAVDRAAVSKCDRVGIDASRFQLEYPFQILLRERRPAVQFFEVGVQNPSRRLGTEPSVCAVLCMDCDTEPALIERYKSVGKESRFGRFVWFDASQ